MPESSNRRNWTESELLTVLSLYCQLPFGRMHRNNPAVVQFAQALGRTPGSVALKLVNFASFDPALQARGIRGMSNSSHLDREIWDRYFGRWEELSAIEIAERSVTPQWEPRPTTAQRLTSVRLGQGFFRNAVLSAYEGACCITGIATPGLLRGSHIVPWAASESQRLDPANGVCLNALHDAAFDTGLIAIDTDYRLLVSASIRSMGHETAYADYFIRYAGKPIRVPERFIPDPECLRYHLQHVFIP